MSPTKSENRKTGRTVDPDATYMANHPRFSIFILLILYTIFTIVPVVLYSLFVNPIFYDEHLYLVHIIDFFSLAILFLVIVPLLFGLPINEIILLL